MALKIDAEVCICCGACYRECMSRAIVIVHGEYAIHACCSECGECAAICPVGCIKSSE